MRNYPNGCRYYCIANGEIGPLRKNTREISISSLGLWSTDYIVVQPRGRMKWYLFTGKAGSNRLVLHGHDPDVLCMAAVLGLN